VSREDHLTRSGRLLRIRPAAPGERVPGFACGAGGTPELVAEVSGRIVGWLERHGPEHVHLCLHPEARGEGVAARMLARVRPAHPSARTVTACQSEA
jgi:hypothetical protein